MKSLQAHLKRRITHSARQAQITMQHFRGNVSMRSSSQHSNNNNNQEEEEGEEGAGEGGEGGWQQEKSRCCNC